MNIKLSRLFLALIALCHPEQADTISDSDRSYLPAHLSMTREFVMDATQNLLRDQWTFKPTDARWSIAQCIDHLARTEDSVLTMVRERLMKASEPITPFPSLTRLPAIKEKPQRLPVLADALLIRAMTDRTPAFATPAESRPPVEVAPRRSIEDPRSAVDHFLRIRAATLEYVRNTQDDLRGHFGYSRLDGYYPQLKFHDGYQWLLRMSAHTERHLMRIQELKRESYTRAGEFVRG